MRKTRDAAINTASLACLFMLAAETRISIIGAYGILSDACLQMPCGDVFQVLPLHALRRRHVLRARDFASIAKQQ